MDFTLDLLTSALALALVGTSLWLGYLFAHAGLPEARPSLRLSAATTATLAVLLGAFHLLTAVHLFNRVAAISLLAGSAGAAHALLGGQRAIASWRADLRAAGARLAELGHTPAGAALAAVALVILLRLCKGLAAPPTSWDSMTYHLVRPAFWIQSAQDLRRDWPDALNYYSQLPVAGDALWGWAMLPVHGDDFIAVAGLFLIAASMLGAYAACISFGADEIAAGLAAAAVALIPAVMNLFSTGYVDNLSVCCLLIGFALLAEHAERPTLGCALLAMVALAVGAANKLHLLAPMAFAVGTILWHCRRDARSRIIQPAAAIAVALPLLAGYLHTWVSTGSPFYPVLIAFRGEPLFPYDAEYHYVTMDRPPIPGLVPTLGKLLLQGFLRPEEADPMGFGPLVPVVALLGLAGAVLVYARDRRLRMVTLAVLATELFFVWTFGAESMRGQWHWGANLARYYTSGMALMMVLAARIPHLAVRGLLLVTVLIGFLMSVPRNVIGVEAFGMIAVGVVLLEGAAAIAVVTWIGKRKAPKLAAAAAALALLFTIARIPGLRSEYRHPIYGALMRQPPYVDLHRILPRIADSHTIWALLDDGPAHRIAVTAGHRWPGHHWFRYPLFGRRLQNQLLYIPILRSGAIVPYSTLEVRAEDPPDLRAWLQRMIDERVEVLVTLYPDMFEARWAQQHPELFALLHRTPSGNAAYTLNTRAIETFLASTPPR